MLFNLMVVQGADSLCVSCGMQQFSYVPDEIQQVQLDEFFERQDIIIQELTVTVQQLAMINEGFGRAMIERQRLDEFFSCQRGEQREFLLRLVEEYKPEMVVRSIQKRRMTPSDFKLNMRALVNFNRIDWIVAAAFCTTVYAHAYQQAEPKNEALLLLPKILRDEFLSRRRIEEQQLVVSYFRVLVKLVEEDKTDVVIRVIKKGDITFANFQSDIKALVVFNRIRFDRKAATFVKKVQDGLLDKS